MRKTGISRRVVLGAAGAAASFMIVPRRVVAGAREIPPSEKINLALIGLGWPGRKDVDALASENIVALCDVDTQRELDWRKKYPGAKQFVDYRKMYDEMGKSIDAVIVATPDHTHAVLAVGAMKRGTHVYCEKPLAHSIWEVREIMKAAKENKVITQTGNQGHSSESIRMFCEWIWDGAIGNVHTIHAGCRSINTGIDKLAEIQKRPPVPENLNWDLWLGPAQERPYSPVYLHESWRGWTPFGDGTLGDWTCHVVDPVFWALDLGAPTSAQAEVKDWDPKTQGDVYPRGEEVTFEFPAKGKRGPVTMKWFSGNVPIPRPEILEKDRKPVDTGAIVFGDKGAIMYGSHGAGGVRIIPEEKMKAYKQPAKTIPRVPGGGHERDWANAIRSGKPAGSDFSYGGALTEIALVGLIAVKLKGTKLEWNSEKMAFANSAEANALIKPVYRQGWSL